MDCITNDLGDKQWESIFSALSTFSEEAAKEEARKKGAPKQERRERVPLPPSNPPSPPSNN